MTETPDYPTLFMQSDRKAMDEMRHLLEQIAQAVSNIPGAVTPLREAAHAVLNVLPDPEPAETERLRRLLYGAPLSGEK